MSQVLNTEFNFEHKVFDAPGAYFSRSPGTKEALMYLQMGENQASLSLDALRTNFEIPDGSNDDELLKLVAKSLPLLKRIRPGDSIPNEVLDGTASWPIEDHHRDLVEMRLTVALAQWITGGENQTVDFKMLIKLAEDPETKKRAQQGIDEIAEKSGIGKANRQKVIDIFEHLKDELSYIQALKEHLSRVRHIAEKLNLARKKFSEDKALADEIDRIQILLKNPFKEYRQSFNALEEQTSDILELVRSSAQRVDLIRQTRDDLRAAFMEWEDLVTKWEAQEIEPESGIDVLIRETYRFAATNFPLTQSWGTG